MQNTTSSWDEDDLGQEVAVTRISYTRSEIRINDSPTPPPPLLPSLADLKRKFQSWSQHTLRNFLPGQKVMHYKNIKKQQYNQLTG